MNNIMYIAINKDLNMSPGKVSAQVAHAAFDYWYKQLPEVEEAYKIGHYMMMDEMMTRFKEGGDTICILKASEKELVKFQGQGYVTVIDKGLTEIPSDSITTVNLGIYDRDEDEIPNFIKRLRLL